MNTDSLAKLKPYMLGLGDAHRVIKPLKIFLQNHPNIPTLNLKVNNLFDKQTQTAIAYVQKNKGLIPTGRLDPDTWIALGTEMSSHQINGLFAADVTAQNLLGLGYGLKHPHGGAKTKKSLKKAVIRTHSKNLAVQSYWYNFTFLVYITAFAPFDWFGPFDLSAGDNKGGVVRRFGIDPNASYRLQCFSTVTATPGERSYDWTKIVPKVTRVSPPTTSTLIIPLPRILPIIGVRTPTGIFYLPKTAKSPGHLRNEESPSDLNLPESDEIKTNSDTLRFHFWGNDRAFSVIGERSWLASDIDMHPDISFHYEPDQKNPKNITMRVYGNIQGDQFPAFETYVLDKNGNGVMLGVWQVR